ncbi:4-hydroxy-3-methylbut-2-enyl diphosphate reductase [Planctomycetes bacterium Pan216]|uniref:4-hydroxy-3-methylbut-2-enyl diphosphate reductase n=1 Tax=Kolteria novifilia TaxID=2527975 RepID=A0A518B307_9BACT|nr:4-hydroxy-3-methylbut-2-enyl diphosphate reductase [Planctomycetes bacterium Pan216]
MDVLLANPRGFCAGVNMAIDTLDRALELCGAPIYVYHEIVHNKYVVGRFRGKGVVFVDDVDEVPHGATLLYSAHGVSPKIREVSRQRSLRTIDATCPLVTKVHLEAIRFAKENYTIVLIGHEGHDEVVGTLGEAPESIVLVENVDDVAKLEVADESKIAYLTQTTLSIDDAERIIRALRERFPLIVGPSKDDICYATQNRQEAVKQIAPEADVVLVLGSQNSSNSQRLREIAEAEGKRAYLVDGASEIEPSWFGAKDVVMITAGASAPEEKVQECVDYLAELFGASVHNRVVRDEHVTFPLPKDLRILSQDEVAAESAP